MSTVYTALLWEVLSSTGSDSSPAVPAGYRWVVTDVWARSPGAIYTSLSGGLFLQDDQGYTIFDLQRDEAVGARAYHWTGRQVVDTGRAMSLTTYVTGWAVRVTGFQLVLP